MNISFNSKMSSSNKKKFITSCFKKSEKEKDQEIEEEPYYFSRIRNLVTILPLKAKLSGKFQRFNAINGSIEMLKSS